MSSKIALDDLKSKAGKSEKAAEGKRQKSKRQKEKQKRIEQNSRATNRMELKLCIHVNQKYCGAPEELISWNE